MTRDHHYYLTTNTNNCRQTRSNNIQYRTPKLIQQSLGIIEHQEFTTHNKHKHATTKIHQLQTSFATFSKKQTNINQTATVHLS